MSATPCSTARRCAVLLVTDVAMYSQYVFRISSTSTTITKYILRAHRYISDTLIVGTTVVHMHCLRSRLYSIS